MAKNAGRSMAGVARGRTSGSFSSSPVSAAKTALTMAGKARGSKDPSQVSTARGGDEAKPAEGDQAVDGGHDAKKSPNPQAPAQAKEGLSEPKK